MGGNATTTSSGTSNQTTSFNPSPNTMNEWNNVFGTASGLANYAINNFQYPGQMVSDPTGLMSQYWQQAGAQGGAPPDVSDTQHTIDQVSGTMANTQMDPNAINLPQFNQGSFQPGQLNLPSFGAVPQVGAQGGVSGLASSYYVAPQQVSGPSVSAQNVSAPTGAVNPITGLMQVAGPQLQQYQMGPAENVNAPNLSNFTMQAAAPVGTQSWTQPGTAQQYMSPYTQQVVNTQLAQAQVQNQQQLEQIKSNAAQAGAFGGSREAVEEANQNLGYQQMAANLEAQGLQSAYQQGTQQFNTEQQMGLQAALANQANQQQANLQNLSSFLQTQGLSAQTGLQAALANQQAGLTVGGQNLSAQLQTQGLGAQLGMQAQLANQSTGLQSALANQQAQEFGAGQQLQASLANQQANLQAAMATAGYNMQGQLANQAAGIQTGLAAQQMGQQGAEFNAGQGLQAALANQAAQMQAQGLQYQGGLQGALQTQQLGLSGAEFGGQLGLQSATNQTGLRQAQTGLNQAALNNQYNMQMGQAGLGLQGYQTGLMGLNALQQGATSQQGYAQQVSDAQLQNWLMSMMLPMQATGFEAGILGMQPTPYTSNTQGVTSGTQTVPGPGIGSLLGSLLGGVGTAGKLFGLGGAKGGSVPSGLKVIPIRGRKLRRPAESGLGRLVA